MVSWFGRPSTKLKAASSVFISHSSKDKHYVALIAAALKSLGANASVDQDFLGAGDDFEARILESIKSCEYLLALWSASSAASAWVGKEIEYAHARKVNIIPCLIDDTALGRHLDQLHYAAFRSDIGTGLRQLTSALALGEPSGRFVTDYVNVLVGHAVNCRVSHDFARNMSIPGAVFRAYDGKVVKIRDKVYEAIAEIQAPDRKFLADNYGGDLASIFAQYLVTEGWTIETTVSDGYRWQTKYQPTLAVAKRDNLSFAYYSVANNVEDNWRHSIYFLRVNVESFLYNVLWWIERDDPLTCSGNFGPRIT